MYIKEQLEALTKKDLLSIIKDNNLKGNSQDNKGTLIEEILNNSQPSVVETEQDDDHTEASLFDVENVIILEKDIKVDINPRFNSLLLLFKATHDLFKQNDEKKIRGGLVERSQSVALQMARIHFGCALSLFTSENDIPDPLGALDSFEPKLLEVNLHNLHSLLSELFYELKGEMYGESMLSEIKKAMTIISVKLEGLLNNG